LLECAYIVNNILAKDTAASAGWALSNYIQHIQCSCISFGRAARGYALIANVQMYLPFNQISSAQ